MIDNQYISEDFYEKLLKVKEALFNLVETLKKIVKRVIRSIFSMFCGGRVAYLAFHSKKNRVRKKNLHRIIRNVVSEYE